MKWLLFVLLTVAVFAGGWMAFSANLISECFPHLADFSTCVAAKERDAFLIIGAVILTWLGGAFLIFRKKSVR